MKLTKDQTESLKSLTKHPWFEVLKLIHQDAMLQLSNFYLDKDIDNPEIIESLKKQRVYAKARLDFFQDVSRHTHEIYSPE